jgi:Papain family cysteine protease/Cathepsin propeptide inhibitor domain (I29)
LFKVLTSEEEELLFRGFTAKFHKTFIDEKQRLESFTIFKNSLGFIDEHNEANIANGGGIVHGLSKFSDMTIDQFKSTFLTASPKKTSLNIQRAVVTPYEGFVASVDWSGKYTTPVTDQGRFLVSCSYLLACCSLMFVCLGFCGACWAFSSVNQIESDAIRLGLIKTTDHLSAEQLISCAGESYGCRGGWTEVGFEYVEENGVALFSTYPYSDFWQPETASTCYADSSSSVITVSEVFGLATEEEMIAHVKGVGPLSVCIDATDWQTYQEGIS